MEHCVMKRKINVSNIVHKIEIIQQIETGANHHGLYGNSCC
jgi:hypothetical protein